MKFPKKKNNNSEALKNDIRIGDLSWISELYCDYLDYHLP